MNKIIGMIVICKSGSVFDYFIDTSSVNFFLRPKLTSDIISASREISLSLPPGKIHTINFDRLEYEFTSGVVCTVCKNEHISVVILTQNYQYQRIIMELAYKLMQSHGKIENESLESLAEKYAKPENVDKIVNVRSELDKTMDVINMTIEKINIRGNDINELVLKSDELKDNTKEFVINSKKLNSCCMIL